MQLMCAASDAGLLRMNRMMGIVELCWLYGASDLVQGRFSFLFGT